MILSLDYSADIPIYQQIRNQVVLGIASGDLAPGTKLPTIRALATELGINMMTVSKAYQTLKSEGYIHSDRRNGAWVAHGGNDAAVMHKLEESLHLIVAEARLNGVKEETIIELCHQFYHEGED